MIAAGTRRAGSAKSMTMIVSRTSHPRAAVVFAAVLAAFVTAAPAAHAADPIFPIGSRIGLVPPAGMSPSTTFQGFEDTADKAAILIATFPSDAFSALDKTMVPGALDKQGITKREPFQAVAGNGFLLTGLHGEVRQWMLVAPAGSVTAVVTARTTLDNSKYTDQVMRTALASVAVRDSIPDAERLSLLPFTVGNLAGFKIEDVLPGRALMLVHLTPGDKAAGDKAAGDKPAGTKPPDKTAAHANTDIEGHPIDARLLIAAVPGGPTDPKDDDNFARVAFNQIGGIRDVRIQDAEPLRIGGQSGYETLATAKDAQSDTDLKVVQWLRFGSGGYMQIIGTAQADAWADVFMPMRTVRDSIDSK